MDRFDRIYEFDKILRSSRYPVSRKTMQKKLECSRATFSRIVEDMRDFLGAPIEYDRRLNGYYYAKRGEYSYELPGLWFNSSEIYSLLACQELLANIHPGLLEDHINPLRKRITEMLESKRLTTGDVGKRIRILKMAFRKVPQEIFQLVADTVLQRKKINITYQGRARGQVTQRDISPQRMVYYRDNWYLDAWCHLRKCLRSFSVDRIEEVAILKEKAKLISEKKLDEYYSKSYGIFAGKPKNLAVLRFSEQVSRWVAAEQWHPEQNGYFVNGEYELQVPYSDPRELILDILRYGADVKVVKPKRLQNLIVAHLEKAVSQYNAE